MRRFYLGDQKTADRWRNRWVEVLVRGNPPLLLTPPHTTARRAPRNALVRFDTGEEVVVSTYSGGIGATLRKEARDEGRPNASQSDPRPGPEEGSTRSPV